MSWDPKKIGGSSAAAALGLSQYTSRTALWERLRNGQPDDEFGRQESRRLEAGKHWEPVARRFIQQDYGVAVTAPDDTTPLVHPRDARIVCHPDGWCGQAGVELKLVGRRDGWGEPDSDDIPIDYLAQCCQGLMLSRAPEWWCFATFWPNPTPIRYIIRRDERLLANLEHQEIELLRMVDAGLAPDPASEDEARRLWFAHRTGLKVEATSAVMLALAKREAAGRIIKLADQVRERAALEILRHAQDAETIVFDGQDIATLRANRVFDELAFREHHPAEAAQCMRFSKTEAADRFPQLVKQYYRPPAGPGESTRQLRLTGQFRQSVDGMLEGKAVDMGICGTFALIDQQEATR